MLESRSPNHFQNLERRTISHRLLAIDTLFLSIQVAPLRRPLLSPQKGRDCIRSYGHLSMAGASFLWQNYNPRSSICSKRAFNELKRGSVLIDSIQGLYMDALQFTPPLPSTGTRTRIRIVHHACSGKVRYDSRSRLSTDIFMSYELCTLSR